MSLAYQPRGGAATLARRVQDPPAGPLLLERPRLLALLSDAVGDAPVTVLSAPAGFGKTVLLRQLALVAASAGSGSGSADRPGAVGVTALLWEGRTVEVVDGGDLPTRPATVQRRLAGLRSRPDQHRVPDQYRAILAVRPGDPLPVSVGIGRQVVIDESDLAFTGPEAASLVERISGRDLTTGQLRDLMDRTGGWPVAVRVAALALRTGADTDAVIAGLSGRDPHLYAYIRHAVLDRQPAEVRRFLVRTSVLERLDGRLCRAVDAGNEPEAMLSRLRRERMFMRVDPERPRAMRYFDLFREALRCELDRSPGESAGLLDVLSRWYTRNGRPDLAGPILIETERWHDLLNLVDRHVRAARTPTDIRRGLEWLDAVPVDTQARRRTVGLRRAFLLTLLGQTAMAARLLTSLQASGLDGPESAMVEVVRAMWVHAGASPSHSVRAARSALLLLGRSPGSSEPMSMVPKQDLEAMASLALGRGMWLLGAVAPARELLAALVAGSDGRGPVHLPALAVLALLEAWAGDLSAAWGHAQAALTPRSAASSYNPFAVDALLALAHVRRERGDVVEARAILDRAGEMIKRIPWSPVVGVRAVEAARLHLATADPEAGLAQVSDYDLLGAPPAPPIVEDHLRATEVRLWLSLGDTRRAETVVEASGPTGPQLASASVQAAVSRRDVDCAADRLRRWPASGGAGRADLEQDFWKAILEFESGRRRQALRRVARVVNGSEDQGYLRMFLDSGPAGQRLLRGLARVDGTERTVRLVDGGSGSGAPAPVRAHELSRREQEIVRYLPTPLSSAQIAAQLYISVNTLKTHLRTIYRKLGVTGRRQAACRAEELGLA